MSTSPNAPGPVLPDPSAISGVNIPPFAVAPDPALVFTGRAARFDVHAGANDTLAPYLTFLADLSRLQHRCQEDLPAPDVPDLETRERARSFEMPPLDRARFTADAALEDTFERLLALAGDLKMPAAASDGLARLAGAGTAARDAMMRNVLSDSIPMEELGAHIFTAAALQVHFARLAARLDPTALVSVGDGVCPACGGPPVASVIVSWPNAYGARYCVCANCAIWWNYVRVRCTACGSTKGIGLQEVDGSDGAVKAETCDVCHTYLKVLYQSKDPGLDPVADDVASLGLDMLMKDGPYRRAGFNPYLLGY